MMSEIRSGLPIQWATFRLPPFLKTRRPTYAQIVEHMEGNLCRCGSHARVAEAINEAASAMKGGA
jgi:xanthine dehydrogenase iron-sulfur cluster and FAD-binding subunit A